MSSTAIKSFFLCTANVAMLLGLLLLPLQTQAQLMPGMGVAGGETVVLRIDPSSPAPGQSVTAEITSTVIDLDRSTITWIVGGKKAPIPAGSKTLTFTAGTAPNSATTVTVVVRTSDGQNITKQQEVRNGALDLLWEADSYTPPFYKGKGLPGAGSSITVTALPEMRDARGNRLNPNDMVFTWTQNSMVVPNASGRGRNTATFPGPEFYKEFDVIVEASTLDQSMNVLNRLTIAPFSPKIIFYESHPTLGVRFENAFSENADLAGGEITVTAQPLYFASASTRDRQLNYRWNLNGSEVQNPSVNQSTIVLRADTEGGTAEVGLNVTHTSKSFQQGQRSFTINFTGDLSL